MAELLIVEFEFYLLKAIPQKRDTIAKGNYHNTFPPIS